LQEAIVLCDSVVSVVMMMEKMHFFVGVVCCVVGFGEKATKSCVWEWDGTTRSKINPLAFSRFSHAILENSWLMTPIW